MPSPVGHALAGVAAGWLAAELGRTRPATLERPLMTAVVFGTLGALPDVDVLVEGTHRLYTHSLVAVALVGLTVAAVPWRPLRSRWRSAAACAAAYGSHLLLDWLGDDRSIPYGFRALWPLSDTYFQAPLRIFPQVERQYWLPRFWTANLRAIAVELALLVPVVLVAWWWRLRRGRAARGAQ